MDDFIYEAKVEVLFEDEFPYAGEEREIVKADKSEWLVEVLYFGGNHEWMIDNGKVIGVRADMKYVIMEEIRPSSKGKLKLV